MSPLVAKNNSGNSFADRSSAAPTKELHPLNPYSDDPWNLNNMPIVKESVLRYIKSDISGMTVPWIYLGMLFSAFCWHNEDHYTYSVNYSKSSAAVSWAQLTWIVHWGETKTWYGVPGGDAEKFEEAIKSEAPELFEQQPALLYQLVTMMNPGRLQDLGVKVVSCNQRPNEFVITWPKAYHCGFNHGINFNEAVNFALPDWLPQGKDCVLRYKQHSKAPVFSHNELLITITLFSDTIKTALWLKDSLATMVEEETARRDQLRAKVPLLTETLVEEDCPEEQYQCCICKGFCYLSQVTCSCTKLVACVDHAEQLCKCGDSKRTLRKRYSENQLEEILATVELRASQPSSWRSRLDNLLEVPRPPLKSMRALLAEGERISYPIEEVEDLRALVTRANTWVDKVAALAQRKSTGRRRKGRQTESEDLDRSPDALSALLAEADRLAFDSPEIMQLRSVLSDIDSFKQQAELILAMPEDQLDLAECQTALILGNSLNIDMAEITTLSTVVNRLLWFKKVDEDVDDRTLSLDDVVSLIKEAEEYRVPEAHATMIELRAREAKGEGWKQAVEDLFAQPKITEAELTALIEGQELVPTDLSTMRQLEQMRKTAQTWQSSAVGLLAGSGSTAAAIRLVKASQAANGPTARISIPELGELSDEIDFVYDWSDRLAKYLGCTRSNLAKTLDLHCKMVDNGLDPEDDTVKEDWATCFCRGSPTAVMVTCDTCEGTYHPKCVSIPLKQADKPFTCEMCNLAFEPNRPRVHTLANFADPNKWNFVLEPVELVLVHRIVESFVRYATAIIDLVDPHDQVEPCRDVKLLAHHMRKLFNIPLYFDAIDIKTQQIVVFEDWLRRRWRDAKDFAEGKLRPPPPPAQAPAPRRGGGGEVKYTRSRKPKFLIKESHEGEFACVCSTPPVDHLLVVTCFKCKQTYHASCVYCPTDMLGEENKWKCPCCTVRAGQHYLRHVELRMQMSCEYLILARSIFRGSSLTNMYSRRRDFQVRRLPRHAQVLCRGAHHCRPARARRVDPRSTCTRVHRVHRALHPRRSGARRSWPAEEEDQTCRDAGGAGRAERDDGYRQSCCVRTTDAYQWEHLRGGCVCSADHAGQRHHTSSACKRAIAPASISPGPQTFRAAAAQRLLPPSTVLRHHHNQQPILGSATHDQPEPLRVRSDLVGSYPNPFAAAQTHTTYAARPTTSNPISGTSCPCPGTHAHTYARKHPATRGRSRYPRAGATRDETPRGRKAGTRTRKAVA